MMRESGIGTLPVTLAERVKTKFVGDLSSIHGIRKILLVGKYKQHSIPQFILQISNTQNIIR